MKNDYYSNSNDYINRWVISYADFVTMLLALFMVMFATSSMGDLKVKDVNKSIQKVFVSKPAQSTDIKQNTTDNQQDAQGETTPQSKLDNAGKTILDGGDGILDAKQIAQQIEKDINMTTSVKVLKIDRGVVIRLMILCFLTPDLL